MSYSTFIKKSSYNNSKKTMMIAIQMKKWNGAFLFLENN